jgi:hypothetical protein
VIETAAQRLHKAIVAHLSCADAIDTIDDVALAVNLATETGDELEDAAYDAPPEFRSTVLEARRKMDATLRRLNQRSLLTGRIALVETQCAWSRAVLARVPELVAITGLHASATGERLDGRDRDALVGWLTEPGVERDMAYEEAVQQILKQPSSPDVVHLQLEPNGTPGKMCHARCDAMIDDPPSQLAVDVMFVTCTHCRNVNALRQALSGGSNVK